MFSSNGRINGVQYFVGYFHYYATLLIILSEADGFARGKYLDFDMKFTKFQISLILESKDVIKPSLFSELMWSIPFATLYLCAWVYQFQSNVLLSNLRRNAEGNVVTEKHVMPNGGFFKYVSSPHMFFEIILYLSLYGILYANTSWKYVLIWVFANQIINAHLTHEWYLKAFRNYPKSRKALIPKIF